MSSRYITEDSVGLKLRITAGALKSTQEVQFEPEIDTQNLLFKVIAYFAPHIAFIPLKGFNTDQLFEEVVLSLFSKHWIFWVLG